MNTNFLRWFGIAGAVIVSSLSLLGGEKEEPESPEGKRDPSVEMHLYLKGRHIYQSQCVPCHGATGRGDGPWSVGLKDKPRNFRMGIFKFRTTPFGKLPTEDDLRRTIRAGISGTAMPTFKKFADSDIEALVVYVKHLSRNWNDESLYAAPLEIPETPEWFSDKATREKHVESGKAQFMATCAACHGPEGHGDGPGSRGLVDVWENPVLPATLSREHHKSGDAPADLYRTIATGLNGTPMVGFVEMLKPEQIWDLVAFIKSIEGTAPPEENAEKTTSANAE